LEEIIFLPPKGVVSNFIPVPDRENYFYYNTLNNFCMMHKCRETQKLSKIVNFIKDSNNFECEEVDGNFRLTRLTYQLWRERIVVPYDEEKFFVRNEIHFSSMKQIADKYTKQNFPSISSKLITGTINYFGIFIDKICCVSACPNLQSKILPMCLFRAISYLVLYYSSSLILDNTQLQILRDSNPWEYDSFPHTNYVLMFINPYSYFLELNYFYIYREFIKQIKNTFPQDTQNIRIYKPAFLGNLLYMICFGIWFYFSFDKIKYQNTGLVGPLAFLIFVWVCIVGIFEMIQYGTKFVV